MTVSKHQKKHKKHKPITTETLFRPFLFTPHNYARFMYQFIDRFNWGSINGQGEKSFHFPAWKIENTPYKSYIKLREKPQSDPRYRDIAISDHLEARQDPNGFVFYTSNIFSDLCLLCGDIDPIEGYGIEECLEAFFYIEKTYFPGCYWELSTTYRGIHFYIIIDFSTFPDKCNLFNRVRCNIVIQKLSALFAELINSMFYCTFDKFCGTYPIYEKPFSKFIFRERGSLAKLPLPTNHLDFKKLVNTPIFTYHQMGMIWEDIQQILHYEDIFLGEKNLIDKSITPKKRSALPLSPNSLCRDSTFQSINDEYLNSTSAWDRTLHSAMILTRELGRIPDYYEWNEYYEHNGWNTGEQTEDRRRRHTQAVALIKKTFDPAKIGHLYKVGEFVDDLKRDINPDQLEQTVKEMTHYRYRVTYQDLDVGLGAHWSIVRKNQKPGRELTVPIVAIVKMFKSLKQKGEINRSCDRDKARAIRIVLQKMGYIYCIDEYYSHKRGDHTAQRWGMGVKFPKYDDYLLFCGDAEKRAQNIKILRDQGRGDEVKSSKFLQPAYRDMFD